MKGTGIANTNLPPVTEIHWHESKSWYAASINILRANVRELLRTGYPNHEVRFTDGSLSSTGVSIGIHGTGLDISRSLRPECSIFSAEAMAILVAVSTPADQPILILTGSASVLDALKSKIYEHLQN